MENEIWKDIPGYEGCYQVSSYGNVRSLERPYTICSKTIISTKSKILKQGIVKGYYNVELNVNGVAKKIFVHRLVALAFIPNINNLPCINHKDENPLNNRMENLEWCTIEYNLKYGTRQERISKNRKRKVLQYSSEGEYIAEYDEAIDAENATGIKRQNISKVILGKRHTAGGYIWKKGGSK